MSDWLKSLTFGWLAFMGSAAIGETTLTEPYVCLCLLRCEVTGEGPTSLAKVGRSKISCTQPQPAIEQALVLRCEAKGRVVGALQCVFTR